MTKAFSLVLDKDGKVQSCCCCEYPAPLAEFESNCEGGASMELRKFQLCKICANTHLSTAVIYPSGCNDIYLYKAVAWIGNYLIDHIHDNRAQF